MKKGKIIILSGPSGVGKGTVNKQLAQDKSLKLVQSVSMTTRAPRPGEVDGVNYFFVDREKFLQEIANGELIEYAEFIGNFYGTPRKAVYDQIDSGKNVILEIEVIGATQVLKKEKPENLVSIFLMPPNLKVLETRLRGRNTEADEIVKQRLDKALLEIPLKHKYQYAIQIDSVENCIEKIKEVLKKENAIEDFTPEQSWFYKLRNNITKEVEESYLFFVENWHENVREVAGEKIDKDFDVKNYLIDVLTDKIYKDTLERGMLMSFADADFVKNKVERAMLDINFFSIDSAKN